VFDHDRPASLPDCLARHGFVAEPAGTLMVFDLVEPIATVPADVRRAASEQDVHDHLAVTDAVFQDGDADRLTKTYLALLDDPHFALFTAYEEGVPVASARLESGPGRQFGGLFGGGVRADYRGRGLYRALVQARADEGRRLGLSYLSTEALETSRPILERMGFVALAREVTWVLPAT
jgi:GNAT superfamily N-acetyltransferase